MEISFFFSFFSSLVGVPVLVFSSLALPSPSEVFVPGKKKTFFKIREKKKYYLAKDEKKYVFFFLIPCSLRLGRGGTADDRKPTLLRGAAWEGRGGLLA